ncbi:MAG: AsmA-like C-terminal region-containing protein [Pseudomonadota bacterium]|nr:AsmA-like C-terminal region-containing protein [Pseudomonadota bacterium]
MTDPTDHEPPSRPDDASSRGARWRPRRLHFHLGIWSVLAIAFVGLFLTLASMSLTGRAVALPDWVADRVEAELNTAMPQGSITLRRIELGVTPKGRPRLALIDVGLRDASGLDIAQLNSIQGGVRLAPLFQGEFVPRTVILTGAQVTFRRLADGTFALQFGQGNTATGNLADVFDEFDKVFDGGILAEAVHVEALGLTIALEDARTGRIWQVTDGRLAVSQTDKIVETEVTFDVFNQTDELAEVEVGLRTSKADSAATLSVSFRNAAAADIGAQSAALSFLNLIDAPIDGALRTTIAADGTISDLAGAMEIQEGAIKPNPSATPVGFGGAKGYLDYDPEQQAIQLTGVTFTSDLGEIELDGKLMLADYQNDWPQSVIGQIRLNRATFVAPEVFDDPVTIDRGFADFRVKLSPFSLDLGQAVLFRGSTRFNLDGRITAAADEWALALNAHVPAIDVANLRQVWPKTVAPKPRDWMFRNVEAGALSDVHIALRGPSLNEAVLLMGAEATGASVRVMKQMPVVHGASGHMSLANQRFVVGVDEGLMTAPNGIDMDVSGSSFTVPDVTVLQGPAQADISIDGPVQGAFSLLALPPFEIFKNNDFGPDVATGHVSAQGRVNFLQKPVIPIEDIQFDVAGTVRDVASDQIIKGSTLTADRLDFTARPEAIEVTGPGKIGDVGLRVTWVQPLSPETAGQGSTVEGTIDVGQPLVEEFNLGLDPSILSGSAPAQFTAAIVPNKPVTLTARSSLVGARLAIPGTGWSKAPGTSGTLELTATLGPTPTVESLSLNAPGLTAAGTITTNANGLERASFSRVRLGGWLDAPVTLTGRGNAPIAIAVRGGRADLRNAGLTSGGGSSGARGPASPLDLTLDELVIAEGIVLQGFSGDFDLSGGLRGTFTSQVAGGARLNGTVAQTENGAAYRINSAQGGEILRGLNLFTKASGGALEVVLAPTGAKGTFEGSVTLTDTRLVDAPAMAQLLSAISVVGLLDQLDGPGIGFTEVKGRFNLSPERLTLYSSSAVSASLGLSMDGYYNLGSNTLDMQGVLSPFYLINSLGRAVSARDGEGLVGFNFNLTGPASKPNVGINPLSVLTPGVLREIFRRQAPQQPAQ